MSHMEILNTLLQSDYVQKQGKRVAQKYSLKRDPQKSK